MNPSSNHYDDSLDGALEKHLCGVLLESREASSFIAVGALQLLLSLLAQMKLFQLRLPLLHAQVLRHSQSFVIQLSLGLVRQGISDLLPSNVLVHETFSAIALMTVASLEITHISDSPLAIVVHRPWRQTTDRDSLQEIPLLLCV